MSKRPRNGIPYENSRRAGLALAAVVGLALTGGTGVTAQGPDRWESAIREFAAEDAASPPPANAIVFTGSSSVRLWETLAEDMAPLTVMNRGFGGSLMQDAVYWVEDLVLKYEPRAVVLYEGDNDIGGGQVSPQELLEGFMTFVSRVHAELPETRIYFLAVKPSILRWGVWGEMLSANELIREYCETTERVTFIDVATPMLNVHGQPMAEIFVADDLHMNAQGYEIWTSVVRPLMLEQEAAYEPAASDAR